MTITFATFAIALFLIAVTVQCYPKLDKKAAADDEDLWGYRRMTRAATEAEAEERKKMAEERKKMFMERKMMRDRNGTDQNQGNQDPISTKENAKSKTVVGGNEEKGTKTEVKSSSTAQRKSEVTTGSRIEKETTTMLTTTTTEVDPNTKRGNADKRTDAALSVVKNTLLTDEPIETGESDSCDNCDLYGISTVERLGRATAIDLDDETKRVKVHLGLRYMNATCNCTFGLASGIVTATVEKFVIFLDVIVNFETDEVDIKNVTVKFPGIINFHFWGYGPIGWIYALFIAIFKGAVISNLRNRIIKEIPELVHEHKDKLHDLGMI